MSSAGSPRPRAGWLWLALLLGGCGVVFAATIGAQAVGTLGAIVGPPGPPVPDTAVQVSHSSTAHGIDTWEYTADIDPCAAVAFYQGQGGSCALREGWCAGDERGLLEISVARCVGDTAFSAFALRWRAEIAAGPQPATTRLTLEREVSWMGALPPETPATP
jgi:hypothetical protein